MAESITHNEFTLEYKMLGTGSEFLVAFHGMGREADDFKIFENTLGKKYTIIAVNLFHHGNSIYPDHRLFENQISKKEFVELVTILLEKWNIGKFSVMGYSLGARVALSCVELLDNRINRIILIAPDGLKKSYYNRFVTNTKFGKRYIKWLVNHPEAFFRRVNKLHAYKIINNRSKRMIVFHFETHEKRLLMRNAISTFKYIVPNLSQVVEHINKNKIELLMIFGKHDFIIPVKLGVQFLKRIKTNRKMHVIDASHNILTENASKQLSDLIK